MFFLEEPRARPGAAAQYVRKIHSLPANSKSRGSSHQKGERGDRDTEVEASTVILGIQNVLNSKLVFTEHTQEVQYGSSRPVPSNAYELPAKKFYL